jgi:hypothetical protein
MRQCLVTLSIICAALMHATPSRAAPAPFSGVLSIAIGEVSLQMEVLAGVANVTGPTVEIPATTFLGGTDQPLADSTFFNGAELFARNLRGSVGPGLGPGGGFGGTITVSGTALFDLLPTFGSGLAYVFLEGIGGGSDHSNSKRFSTTRTLTHTTVSSSVITTVPITHNTLSDTIPPGTLRLQVVGEPWTTGPVTAMGYSVSTFVHTPASAAQSVVKAPLTTQATGGYSGTTGTTRVISLVAPVVFVRDLESPFAPGTTLDERIPSIARLTLTVPEPRRAVLHLASLATLFGVGLLRLRRR